VGQAHLTAISNSIAGKKDQLVGRIQERYGISKDEAPEAGRRVVKVQKLDERDVMEPPPNRKDIRLID